MSNCVLKPEVVAPVKSEVPANHELFPKVNASLGAPKLDLWYSTCSVWPPDPGHVGNGHVEGGDAMQGEAAMSLLTSMYVRQVSSDPRQMAYRNAVAGFLTAWGRHYRHFPEAIRDWILQLVRHGNAAAAEGVIMQQKRSFDPSWMVELSKRDPDAANLYFKSNFGEQIPSEVLTELGELAAAVAKRQP